MSRLARVVVALAVVLTWSIAEAAPASACSCASLTEQEALERADVVFSATLLKIRTPGGERWSSTDPERFVFEVDTVYKGRAHVQQSVVTARDGASCGLELVGAGPFLVFATTGPDGMTTRSTEPGELHANLCGGSRALTAAPPSSFGIGQPPMAGTAPVAPATGAEGEARLLWSASGAVAAVVLGRLVWLVAARRRR